MSVLKIRDKNGKFQEILALKGEKGDPGEPGVVDEERIATLKTEILNELTKMIDGIQHIKVGQVIALYTDEAPKDLFGYGAWRRIGVGRTLIGVDEGDERFATPGLTGGAYGIISHQHEVTGYAEESAGGSQGFKVINGASPVNIQTGSTGETTTDNIPVAYETVYYWRRLR